MKAYVVRRLSMSLGAILVPFMLAACADYASFHPTDVHGYEEGVSLEQFCELLPEAHCRWQIDCEAGIRESCDLFRNVFATRCEAIGASVEAGRIVFDRKGGRACLDKLVDGSCLEVTETCHVFLGQVPARGDCDTGTAPIFEIGGDECAEGRCSPGYPGLPATCRGLEGDECSNYPGASGCGPGMFCLFGSAMCTPLLGEGELCSSSTCAEGLRCVGSPPVCTRTFAEGAACEDSTQCSLASVCAAGRCLRKTLRGEACLRDHNCPPNDQCVYLEGDESAQGTCFGGMTGDPCVLDRYLTSRDCRWEYSCVATGTDTTTCQPVDGLACETDSICTPFWCRHTSPSGGICTPPGNEGDTCVDLRNSWEEPPYRACKEDLVCMDGLCRPSGG